MGGQAAISGIRFFCVHASRGWCCLVSFSSSTTSDKRKETSPKTAQPVGFSTCSNSSSSSSSIIDWQPPAAAHFSLLPFCSSFSSSSSSSSSSAFSPSLSCPSALLAPPFVK
ncbi:uncharacterized protein BJX67DRAFT_327328 [Aspergillus lucknowensis]|uniref:Secreted protein n=1 Tax=Aspergillus lucknowensis TaxID=176173 RepID=A0ABR4L8M1_9EURO